MMAAAEIERQTTTNIAMPAVRRLVDKGAEGREFERWQARWASRER
jgi:hypothetical protein